MPSQSNGKGGMTSAGKPNSAKPKGFFTVLYKLCAGTAKSQEISGLRTANAECDQAQG
jgi:hypothetical protein